MQENIERRYLILDPPMLEMTFLNIHLDPYSVDQKYVIFLIPTLRPPPLPQEEMANNHQLIMNLAMALVLGGSSSPTTNRSMKIMLWWSRGANYLDFRRNLHFLFNWNNPTILCLMETRIEDHTSLLNEFNFTDRIQVFAQGYSSGIVMLWRAHDLIVDPIAITAQELHASVQADAP
uniref:Uncharacterized protein n=1 Tax=Nicotiana tabacum TaxID=4097 RepID=A0A1S4D5V4_TOBAC|nr:PREDICTED: uncharacterized protein LOC107826363 [Nicotiana tabacum]XP_018623454.1 uncharacterized protein LOC108943633 [Nicotiana tomentosiformis]